jgi:hypothetical protein
MSFWNVFALCFIFLAVMIVLVSIVNVVRDYLRFSRARAKQASRIILEPFTLEQRPEHHILPPVIPPLMPKVKPPKKEKEYIQVDSTNRVIR